MNSKFFICFGIIIFIFLMTFVSADWLMFHHDPQQTGYAEKSSAPGVNHTIWNFSSRLMSSSPVITQGMVIITSPDDNNVYALNITNGGVIWNVSIPDLGWDYTLGCWICFASFSPAVADNTVFVGNAKCKIYALNLSNGRHMWNFSGNGVTASLLAVQNRRLIFRCHDDGRASDTVYLLDSSNGSLISANKFPYHPANVINPAIRNGIAYMTIHRCTMSAVNLTTGKILWNFTVQEGCGDVGLSHPVLLRDLLIFGSDKGWVYFVNVSNPLVPSQRNKINIGEAIIGLAPAIWKDMIFLGTGYRTVWGDNLCRLWSTFGNFYAINLTNNSIAWKFPVGDAIQSSPAVADGKVFFLAQNNIFYALNVSNGALIWRYVTNDTGCASDNVRYSSSPAVSDGVVVIGVPEGKVYAFKTIQLVFVKVAWDDSINFNNFVNQSANYFLEKSGLNTCGMRVEIEIVPGSVPDITGSDICTAWARGNTSDILRKIKDWALKNDIRGDRYIGLTTYDMRNDVNCNGTGGYTHLIPDIHYDTAIAQHNNLVLISHELGHSYGLCDEYCYDGRGHDLNCWLQQNASLAWLGGCPNFYPCNDRNFSCRKNDPDGTLIVSGLCHYSAFSPYDTTPTPPLPPDCILRCDEGCPFIRIGFCMCWCGGAFGAFRNYCNGSNSSECGGDKERCSCNNPNIHGGTYLCARGQCIGGLFYCHGFRFADDTFSIMGLDFGDPAMQSNYTRESITHLRRVLCENKGFIALPPLATYNGTSGVAASKYISKSIDQKDGNYLKVSFILRNDGTGSFKDIEILKDGEIADVPRGDYFIVLKNNKREVLYTKSFGVSFIVMGEPPKIYNETSITFTIPYVDGAKSIEIRRGDRVLFSASIPIINNGGFETGDFTGWIAGGPGDHKADTQTPYAGSYSALIGFRDSPNVADGYDYIYQTIEVPFGKESELSFYYRFYSYDYCSWDFFTMHIRDEEGNVLATHVNHCLHGGGLKDTGWIEVKHNLTPYAGRKIQVYFEVSNRYDALYNSWAYVDNVSVRSVSQWVNGGFETGDLRGWIAGGDGCRPDWVTIVNSSAKPGLVRSGNYAAVGNAPWTGSYSNPGRCVPGWFCPEDAILTKQIRVPAYNITGGFYLDFYTMIQTGSSWQSQVRVTVRDLTTGEIIYARGNGRFSGYHGLECPPGNCNAGRGRGCTEPNDNWQYHHVSLNGRENRTIELQLRSHNCCWCSLFYVDDVCIADKDGVCI